MVTQETVQLLLAARNGDLAELESKKVTESLQDSHGANCLHYAARGGSVTVLKYLVGSLGFKPSRRSKVGATALHDAAATGNLEALKWLLEQADVKVDDQDGTGATVTHLSARYGHAQVLEWLLDETNCDMLKKAGSGAVPVHFAAEGGHAECAKILVAEAPRSINMQMNNGSTPVYLACQQGHLLVAQFLADKNGSPKIHTFDGMSPLHAAAQMGHLHVVHWLIKDQSLNPNERDFDGATPLHYAVSCNREKTVDWLLREGGARIILDNLGGSPLHTAAEFGNVKIVHKLLANGCDRDITDNEGLTAQELADKCGHKRVVALLKGEVIPEESNSPPAPAITSKIKPPPSSSSWQSPSSPQQPLQPQLVPQTSSPLLSPSSHPTQPLPGVRPPSPGTSLKRAPPSTLPKPPSPLPLRASPSYGASPRLSASSDVAAVSAVVDSLENLESNQSPEPLVGRSVSVKADVHESPGKVCVFSSAETGEREIGQCSRSSSDKAKTTSEQFTRAAASASFYIENSASFSSSQLPPIKNSYLSSFEAASHINGYSDSDTQYPPEARGSEKGESGGEMQREASPSVKERKVLLETAAMRKEFDHHQTSAKVSAMEVKVNGTDRNASREKGSTKSVIQISDKNVTIISTGIDSPKVTTTPLRNSNSEAPPRSQVSPRQVNSDFIATLSQKFQTNGAPLVGLVRPKPGAAVNSSGHGSHSGTNKINADASSSSSSSMKPWQQRQEFQKQQHVAALQRRQQSPDVAVAPPPVSSSVPMLNGHAEAETSVSAASSRVNGHDSEGSSSVVAPPAPPAPPPPPPPPFAPVRIPLAGEHPAVNRADASYTPRPKSFPSYSSANGSVPGTPRVGAMTPENQQKFDLMAALTAVVTSGSPSASLRKTRGPGKKGVNEISSSHKMSGAATPNGTAKLSTHLPAIAEFDPKNFLSQVSETDSAGNRVPDWKRQMKAKQLAQKAHEDYVEQKKVDDYEARFKNMPAWKRAIIEKKEAAGISNK